MEWIRWVVKYVEHSVSVKLVVVMSCCHITCHLRVLQCRPSSKTDLMTRVIVQTVMNNPVLLRSTSLIVNSINCTQDYSKWYVIIVKLNACEFSTCASKRYVALWAIWDRRVTCHLTQLNMPCYNTKQTGWYSIYPPQRDGRLSWPWWQTLYT